MAELTAKEWLHLKALKKADLQEITTVIGQVQDVILATLLAERYINGRSWRGVAYVLNYSTRHVRRLHKKALEVVQGILETSGYEVSPGSGKF